MRFAAVGHVNTSTDVSASTAVDISDSTADEDISVADTTGRWISSTDSCLMKGKMMTGSFAWRRRIEKEK